MTTLSDLDEMGTATIAEAWTASRVMEDPPRPLIQDMSIAGYAMTVRCCPGDNLALHRAIADAPSGDFVLVVDYGGCVSSGPFGEIMALACQVRNIVGLIIDGAVRDSVQISKMGFPVFARGKSIRGTSKNDKGLINVPLEMGGIVIETGDLVVADPDGIVVLSPCDRDGAISAARARISTEADIMLRLKAGETTMHIFKFEQ